MNLIEKMLELGALKVGEVKCAEIPFNAEFRKACESNTCGMYNRCWTCPPCAGDIDTLIATAQGYDSALVYQTVSEIEDSFDIEGMLEAGKAHNKVAMEISKLLYSSDIPRERWLHLGAGGCRVCEVCAKRDEQPCRNPDMALSSLETYGIAVSELATLADMKYINGQNTITYFGAVFLRKE